ncbi:hypothetical protein N5079_14890 [Planotetraspora sp. A-T 1434]|uniref:hypothetical protein n=1 Tax=Planotetraspora sp. A-T 1434 TaxID=2979219 RepID=UPI0021BF7330|nr:hypothetical protein [Planotetraspora sp. A-T 1434]MCT9931503.1 hypothetical protein [Planotetraspora sp. A-T 1434]
MIDDLLYAPDTIVDLALAWLNAHAVDLAVLLPATVILIELGVPCSYGSAIAP